MGPSNMDTQLQLAGRHVLHTVSLRCKIMVGVFAAMHTAQRLNIVAALMENVVNLALARVVLLPFSIAVVLGEMQCTVQQVLCNTTLDSRVMESTTRPWDKQTMAVFFQIHGKPSGAQIMALVQLASFESNRRRTCGTLMLTTATMTTEQ
jgi:hypothetical protein